METKERDDVVLVAWDLALTRGEADAEVARLAARLRTAEIAHMLSESAAVLLLAGPELVEVAREAAADLPVDVRSWADWDAWLAGPGEPERAEHTVAAPILFSSGTTGRPKRTLMPRSIFPRGATLAGYRAWAGTNRFVGHGPHLVSGPLYHSGPIQATALLAVGVPVH